MAWKGFIEKILFGERPFGEEEAKSA